MDEVETAIEKEAIIATISPENKLFHMVIKCYWAIIETKQLTSDKIFYIIILFTQPLFRRRPARSLLPLATLVLLVLGP